MPHEILLCLALLIRIRVRLPLWRRDQTDFDQPATKPANFLPCRSLISHNGILCSEKMHYSTFRNVAKPL